MKTILNQILTNYIQEIIVIITKKFSKEKIIKTNSENKIKMQQSIRIMERRVTIPLNVDIKRTIWITIKKILTKMKIKGGIFLIWKLMRNTRMNI